MAYQSGDDPLLLSDLRTALKRWHRPTLGDAALAERLADPERRLAADAGLTRSRALRQTIRAALSYLRDQDRADQADLLKRRYLHDESVTRLTETYNLSERSIYHRLHEALVALAHALWVLDLAEAALGSPTPSEASRARHLPPQTYTHLFGMDEVLDQLLSYLADPDGHWVICLDGLAGLGKTALAREATGHLAGTDRFADIAWVTVRTGSYTPKGPQGGNLPDLTCAEVLETIAGQLGGADLAPLPLPAKRDRVHELLDTCSYLVVLDNLETIIDCGPLPEWLWEMARPSKFLLTSRHWLKAEVGQSVLSLDQLAEPDSLGLIRHEAHLRGLPEVIEAPDETLCRILAVTGGNPLAIKLVVGQLVSLPLDYILATLETAHPSTDSFYQYLYLVSWELISAPAKHLMLSMAQLPASGAGWEDLSRVSGLSSNDLAAAIEELVTHSLLQATGLEKKTYCIHLLTHHFAQGQAAQFGEAEGITA